VNRFQILKEEKPPAVKPKVPDDGPVKPVYPYYYGVDFGNHHNNTAVAICHVEQRFYY
jgi:hypothetical protein